MRKILISSLFIGGFLANSCQTDLDIKPEDLTTREEAFKTELGVKSFVTGMYGLAQQEGALNGVPQEIADFQSDNVSFKGSFPTLRNIRDFATVSDNGNVFSIWDDHYEVISQANIIINKINTCPDPNFTTAERNQAVGEAKFMRALMYLQLNSLFSQPIQNAGLNTPSVPLITSVIEDSDLGRTGTPRATAGQIYAQIESDLLSASVLMTNTSVKDKSIANPLAAKALLSRVYLYQDKFLQAANLANEVINSGNASYKLASNFLFYDNPENDEHIFTLVNVSLDAQGASANDGTGSSVAFSNVYNSGADGARGDCPFSANLIAAFNAEPNDLRFALKKQEVNPIPANAIRFFTTKFSDAVNRASDVPVLRMAEMYLIRAEANLRGGTSIGDSSLNDVNEIRKRAGLASLASVTLTDILNERRKEFCFEGHRRMDLLRNNLQLRSVGLPQANVSLPGMNKVIMPIPQREIDLSVGKVLKQNPGY